VKAASDGAVFDLYADAYDLLYRDKDYAAEAAYVRGCVQAVAPAARSLLELGCGTGGHALPMAAVGWSVRGVDLSARMLERSRARAAAEPALASRLRFESGDVRHYRAAAGTPPVDAVVSLFHVMSYQTQDDDLAAALATARAHLAPGGAFVFDVWWGPAVLSDRPRHVVREVSDAQLAVTRTSTPRLVLEDNLVEVRFDVTMRAADGRTEQTTELHRMRYWFGPELRRHLAAAGLAWVRGERWLHGTPLDDCSWYATVVAVAV